MNNLLKLGVGFVGGYIIANILTGYLGYGGFPQGSNEELWDSMMLAGGGLNLHPSGHIGGKSGGQGGAIPRTGAWPSGIQQRAFGADGFPQDPSYINNQSKCTPDELECGMTGACMFHKFMCSTGLWK